MQFLDGNRVVELYGAVIPLAILLIKDDEERALMAELYVQYKGLMFNTAIKAFPNNRDEVDEAVSEATVKMCRYSDKFLSIPCNKRAKYMVRLVENVCRDRIRYIMVQKEKVAFSMDDENYNTHPLYEDMQQTIFSYARAEDLLDMFYELSDRDQELIRMRHIDGLEFSEISSALNMGEGAVRTALSRAKHRLEKLVDSKRK